MKTAPLPFLERDVKNSRCSIQKDFLWNLTKINEYLPWNLTKINEYLPWNLTKFKYISPNSPHLEAIWRKILDFLANDHELASKMLINPEWERLDIDALTRMCKRLAKKELLPDEYMLLEEERHPLVLMDDAVTFVLFW